MKDNKEYYFKHDYNPTNDPKIVCLLGNFGGLGYGIFWRIVEMLHQEKEYKLPLKTYIYEAIAKQMLANAEQIQAIIFECINTYELFVSDGTFFWSNRVLDNLEKQQKISNIRSLAGRAGAIAKQNLAKPAKEKKRKEKKRKENIIIESGEQISPTPKEIANKFFNDFDYQENIVNSISEKYNIYPLSIRNEINKFITYWTEPNSTGKKRKWEMQQTFDVQRRLSTWLNRVNNFNNKKQTYAKIDYSSE